MRAAEYSLKVGDLFRRGPRVVGLAVSLTLAAAGSAYMAGAIPAAGNSGLSNTGPTKTAWSKSGSSRTHPVVVPGHYLVTFSRHVPAGEQIQAIKKAGASALSSIPALRIRTV